jgi:hypothetical protein
MGERAGETQAEIAALNTRIENLIASYNAKVADFAAETLRFETAHAQVFDQIRQKQAAAEALAVVEEVLVARCQHATDDNADLRSALLELRIVRSNLDLRVVPGVAANGEPTSSLDRAIGPETPVETPAGCTT